MMRPSSRFALALLLAGCHSAGHGPMGDGGPPDAGPSPDGGDCTTASGNGGTGCLLYVMNGAQLATQSFGRSMLFHSLQGVVNQSAPHVFLDVDLNDFHDADWLAVLRTFHGVSTMPVASVDDLVSAFHASLAGYVLFDSTRTDSINVALSVAGVAHAVAVDQQDASLTALMMKNGLSPLVDVSGHDYTWLQQSPYWAQLSRGEIVEIRPRGSVAVGRDFGVARGMVTFFDDPTVDPSLSITHQLLSGQSAGGRAFGWGWVDNMTYYEESFVKPATQANLGWVATDQGRNFSIFMHYPLPSPLMRPTTPTLPTSTAVHYVTVVYSDGDNMGAIENLFSSPKDDRFGGPNRGKVPIGWTVPPLAAQYAPPVLEQLYQAATANDDFVAGPSSWGYLYPSLVPDKALLTQTVDQAMKGATLSSVMVLDFGATGFNNASLDPLTAAASVKGVFYSALRGGDPTPPGAIFWSNGKPIVATAPHIGFGPTPTLATVANALNAAAKDATQPSGYTAIFASLWGTSVSDLVTLQSMLGPSVAIVRPDVFLALLTQNVAH